MPTSSTPYILKAHLTHGVLQLESTFPPKITLLTSEIFQHTAIHVSLFAFH